LLSVSLERVNEKNLVDMLFLREDSRAAARVFLGRLKGRKGRLTKAEMSGFARDLASGRLGVRLSRTNFYRTILSNFMDLGLVAEDLVYDQDAMKVIRAYRAVVQPVSGQKPASPSLIYLAHVIAARWNDEMFGPEIPADGEAK
jgi:hypothetical protein